MNRYVDSKKWDFKKERMDICCEKQGDMYRAKRGQVCKKEVMYAQHGEDLYKTRRSVHSKGGYYGEQRGKVHTARWGCVCSKEGTGTEQRCDLYAVSM